MPYQYVDPARVSTDLAASKWAPAEALAAAREDVARLEHLGADARALRMATELPDRFATWRSAMRTILGMDTRSTATLRAYLAKHAPKP